MDARFRAALGGPPLQSFGLLLPDRGPQEMLAVLEELEDEEDARSGARSTAFAGAAELLVRLPPGRWALVTSNFAHRVRARFERAGLPLPPVVVAAGDVRHGKPDPEPYLLAAERVGRRPQECLVVEDGAVGVAAARAAGMAVWAVGRELDGADRSFPSLEAAVPDVLAWVA